MYTVKLENEYLRGAVWVLGEDGITTEGKLPLVENDPMVLEINEEIAEMYDSYLGSIPTTKAAGSTRSSVRPTGRRCSPSSQHSAPGWRRSTTARLLSLTTRRPTCSPCSGAA